MEKTKIFMLLILAIFILCFLVTSFKNVSLASENDKIIIALDPGHGGKQPGAVNGSLVEKIFNSWLLGNPLCVSPTSTLSYSLKYSFM